MIFFIEALYLTNYITVFCILSCVRDMAGGRGKKGRIHFFAGVVALLYTLFPDGFTVAAAVLICSGGLMRHPNIRSFLCCLYINTVSALCLFGIVGMCAEWKIRNVGFVTAFLCIAVFCLVEGLKYYKENKNEVREENKRYYPINVSTDTDSINILGYYDSGNRVYAKNGERVILADRRVYTVLRGKEESVTVRTLNGISVLPMRSGTVKIYFTRRKHKIYRTKIACAPLPIDGCGVILHSDMIGGSS